MISIFKLVGALGILLISAGVLVKERKERDALYICGGVCLEAYSIYINDLIFIIMQLIFTCAVAYDFVKTKVFKK